MRYIRYCCCGPFVEQIANRFVVVEVSLLELLVNFPTYFSFDLYADESFPLRRFSTLIAACVDGDWTLSFWQESNGFEKFMPCSFAWAFCVLASGNCVRTKFEKEKNVKLYLDIYKLFLFWFDYLRQVNVCMSFNVQLWSDCRDSLLWYPYWAPHH